MATKTKTKTKQKKVSNFDLAEQSKYPHDNASLGDEVACKDEGITRTCTNCQHVWYLNREIHTCACRTCQKAKRGKIK